MGTKEELFALCKKRGGCELDELTYQECANFLFLTSWFEERLFSDKMHQNPKNDEKICCELVHKINLSDFDFMGDHYCERYLKDDTTTKEYRNLKLSKEVSEKVLKPLQNFQRKRERSWELLYAYLMIVYRFRNNMFHGAKGLINLNKYVKQFQINNQFLYKLIDIIFECGYYGYNEKK